MYYFDANFRLVKVVYNMPKLIPVRSLVPTNLSLETKTTCLDRTNVTMKFVSETKAVIFDGYDTLYICEIDQSLKTEDPLVSETWSILFKWQTKSVDNCHSAILKDVCMFENNFHVLLVNIQESHKTEKNACKFETLVHWLEITSSNPWSVSRTRVINCYDNVPEYLALETNGESVYVAGPSFIEFMSDSVKPVALKLGKVI